MINVNKQLRRVAVLSLAVLSLTFTWEVPGDAFGALQPVSTGAIQGSVSVTQGSDQQVPIEQLARQALQSTVTLYMFDSDGQLIASGTGFFVAPNVLVTNFHVIHGTASAIAKFAGSDKQYQVQSVLASDPKDDLAVLYVPGTNAPTLKLASYAPRIGQAVYVAGSPLDLEGTFSQGILSSIREDGTLQVTAPVSHGNSGSPVLDAQGNVIGVINSGRPDGSNIGFAIPGSALQKLLSSIS
jgi:serine protease Do